MNCRRCLLSILSNFYTEDIVKDPKYKFSPSGVYYSPPKTTYDMYVEFIKVSGHPVTTCMLIVWCHCLQELPMSQHPEVFGMHDNVDISKELQETKDLFDSVLVTQSQKSGGGSGKTTEEALNEITSDILSKVQ